MLAELRVSQLGVIEDLTVVLGPGMTVLTGETGAGKTLIVDAISLLLGGRADPTLVRPGAAEAVVEGRFVTSEPEIELVLSRVIPVSGRARAYIDGRMASAKQLEDLGGSLIDLHGQHAHQSLLSPAAQRAALDAGGGISTLEVLHARRTVRALTGAQADLGGDARARARELDLLRYQAAELDAAELASTTEDVDLRAEEDRLSDASGLRRAAATVVEELAGDDGVVDRIGALVPELICRVPLASLRERLLAVQAELSDVASDARSAIESFPDDPDRLAAVGARRRVLTDLRHKYGESLAEVIAFREELTTRIAELEDHENRAARLDGERAVALAELTAAETRLGTARRAAAPDLAAEVEASLRDLAMPRARFDVDIGPSLAGDDVTWLLGANPGEQLLPLAKVASGGELARTMLAVRLVLTRRRGTGIGGSGIEPAAIDRSVEPGAEPVADPVVEPGSASAHEDRPLTLVFDEVDAGIGGEAAVAVGRALAALGREHQVLVVTHLPQVAAFGDQHLVVHKQEIAERTVASAETVEGPARVVELSRMLSGRPDSKTARRHAQELLSQRQGPSPSGVGYAR